MPVRFGKICRNANASLAERFKEMGADICIFVRVEGAVFRRDLIIGILRVPHAETVMVFCSKKQIFYTCLSGQISPFFRFKTERIKGFVQGKILLLELFPCDFPVDSLPGPVRIPVAESPGFHNPQLRIRSPVHHKPQLLVLKPIQLFQHPWIRGVDIRILSAVIMYSSHHDIFFFCFFFFRLFRCISPSCFRCLCSISWDPRGYFFFLFIL